MGGGTRIVTASPPLVACGCRSRFETMSVNVADKVDEKMRDHVGDEIAPPDIEDG